jgi:hypothetical protein
MAITYSRYAKLDDLSAANLKDRYLKDILIVDRDGTPWPDSWYEGHIQNSIMEFERETKIPFLEKVITDELHDYNVGDYIRFAFMQLYEWPVRSIERVAAIYPTGQQAMVFPPEWIKLNKEHGQFTMVPTQGSLSQVMIGQGGSYLPLIYNGLSSLPHLFHIDYTAGFDPNEIPWDVMDCIFKLAAVQTLTIAADTIYPPGLTSLSTGVDGLSQSQGIMNNGQLPPVFTGRIKLYRAELYGGAGVGDIGQQGKLASLRDAHRGIHMTVA